ncbi:MAG: family 10 glycosylhydrolase [Clostridia bacterium]|nr:family 10 glycosylhydrolase [Clostridia bacterium]
MNTANSSVWRIVVKTTALLLTVAASLSWTSVPRAASALARVADNGRLSAFADAHSMTAQDRTTPIPNTISPPGTSKIPITYPALPVTTSPLTTGPLITEQTAPMTSKVTSFIFGTTGETVPATTPATTPQTLPVTVPQTTPTALPVTTPIPPTTTAVQTKPVTTTKITTPATTTTTLATTPATTPVTTPATTQATVPLTTPATAPVTSPVTTPVTTPAPAPETSAPVTVPTPDEERNVLVYDDWKAIWVSQFDLNTVYVAGGVQREVQDYTRLIEQILDNIRAQGFNTVFLQVRPNADSMVLSDYYPMSKYVVGAYGREAAYDPVSIFLEAAHLRGLSVHAWINPLRAMTTEEIKSVNPRYQIRQWYDDKSLRGKYIVAYSGNYYLNPAYEEVRNLIVSGAKELLDEYAFDGLHMDDYFYPTTASSFDASAYSDYQKAGGTLSLAKFRRKQLNLLVSALYDATKAESPDLVYGISPAGEIERVFERQYADVYKWCAEDGYIDYICPQVYFGFEHDTLDFASVCTTYRDIIKSDSVKLIVGVTFGKAKDGYDKWAGSGKYEWQEHKDILKRSLEYTETLDFCTGISVYCYKYFFDPITGESVAATEEERTAFVSLLKEISWQEASELPPETTMPPITEELPETNDDPASVEIPQTNELPITEVPEEPAEPDDSTDPESSETP